MCSILTVFSNSTLSKSFTESFPDLLAMSLPRGPDESDIKIFDKKIILGSNRLRIIGEAVIGRMPLKSSNGDYWICFNGEIYNYIELREELFQAGFEFNTKTDTEVLLNSYIHFGDKFIKKLNGIFAFTIWDKEKNKIIAGRDRFGCKPLYYIDNGNFIALSSDFNVLLQLDSKEKDEIDHQALTSLLKCRFVPGERTIFKNIKKLLPGQTIYWDLETLNSKKRVFWRPNVKTKDFNQDEFNQKLSKAISLTARADTKASILLSGGLDSSAIASHLGRKKTNQFRTFSCYFKGATKELPENKQSNLSTGNLDESHLALEVAERYNYEHEVFEIDHHIDEDKFNKIQNALGEPIAVTNALGLYLLGEKLKGKTKLSLSGSGADELLGGYQDLYFKAGYDDFVLRTPQDYLDGLSDFDGGSVDPLQFLKSEYINEDYLQEYTKEVFSNFKDSQNQDDLLNQLSVFELGFALVYWEMDMADKLFMDHSIELRPSFLENEFVDYCLSIKSKDKVNKNPLRKMYKKLLPETIIKGRKIPSLSTPLSITDAEWFIKIEEDLMNNPLPFWDEETLASEEIKSKVSFDVYYRIIYLQKWFKNLKTNKIKVI